MSLSVMINQTPEDISKLELTLNSLDLLKRIIRQELIFNKESNILLEDLPSTLKVISQDVDGLVSWYTNMHSILTDSAYAQEMYDVSELIKE